MIANVLVSIISLFESFQKSVWLYVNRTFDDLMTQDVLCYLQFDSRKY